MLTVPKSGQAAPHASAGRCKTPRAARKRTASSSSAESSATGDRNSTAVAVYCRLRPPRDETDAAQPCIKLLSPQVLSLCTPADSKAAVHRETQCTFKHIFTSQASQREVFDHVALPLLGDLLRGRSGLLFTYGVTGSGKTFTLTGDPDNPGIMPRAIYAIFNSVEECQTPRFMVKSDRMNGFEVQSEHDRLADERQSARSGATTPSTQRKMMPGCLPTPRSAAGNVVAPAPLTTSNGKHMYHNSGERVPDLPANCMYAVFVSYTEIYNNTVFDLLDETNARTLQSKIVREDGNRNMYVNGVVEVEVKSAAEAFELFNLGQRRKRMAHTALNAESSRSHSIFNIRVVMLDKMSDNEHDGQIPDRNLMRVGQLSLVDLAGSERTNRTQNTGSRLREASNINNSLMALRNCMDILRDNQLNGGNRLVPYRDTRLTLLFKNYFEGEGKVEMVVCASTSAQDYDENLQVMKFAEVTQEVQVSRPESRYTPYRKQPRLAGDSNPSSRTPHHAKHTLFPATPGAASAGPAAAAAALGALVFGPKLAEVRIDIPGMDANGAIRALVKRLRQRSENAVPFNAELKTKQVRFRERLLALSQQQVLLSSEVGGVKLQLRKERAKSANLETKVLDLQSALDARSHENSELQDIVRALRATIDEKDLRLNQTYLDKERQKQKLAKKEERMEAQLDEKLRRQGAHLRTEVEMRDRKLQQVRALLDHEQMIADRNGQPDSTLSTPPHSTGGSSVGLTPGGYNKLDIPGRTPVAHLLQPRQRRPLAPAQHEQQFTQTPRAAGVRGRRSRSAGPAAPGDRWLEHNAVKPVPLATVLQPTMRRRKSVTKLTKASDVTHPKQSKYCLIAQEPDAATGELETCLYKADIVPTCGGGAQVIFNDVERLRQESPTGTPR